ncbi:MAG: thiamine phosphate synthase [Myxococcales bacterium]|nr:thiamine phosphate synthase [Myxococcales bacterium]
MRPLWLCADLELGPLEALAASLAQACAAGPVTVWVRHPERAPEGRLVPWIEGLRGTLPRETRWVIADRVDLARALSLDGVHLPRGSFGLDDARALVGPRVSLSTPFHADAPTPAEWPDAVLISPFRPVAGKGPALGSAGLAAMTARCPATVSALALGGIEGPETARAACEAGADGVAVRRAWFASSDPAETVRSLRRALDRLGPPGRR